MKQLVGIDKIGVYVPERYIEMKDLAIARDIDPDKFRLGLGQDQMAFPTIEQDIVAMGANAAFQIIDDEDRQLIDQVIFATESSFDFSKAAATYIHELLDIQPFAKSYEMKQACYSGTAGLQAACDYVRLRPERKVLVITSDIARYGLNTPAEATQGAGAIALLVSANPRILAIHEESVAYTTNDYDFWRPSYSDVALVDGKYSAWLYQDVFKTVMDEFESRYSDRFNALKALALHLPFTRMGEKALKYYQENSGKEVVNEWLDHYSSSTQLSRRVGNIYTGSLYLGLASLLQYDETLAPKDDIGLFSYGSGAVAEILTGTLQSDYKKMIDAIGIDQRMDQRRPYTVAEYEAAFNQTLSQEDGIHKIENENTTQEGFVLDKIDEHRRYHRHHSS
ncbi:hydroxymethylglutaryl-CoA synthase [Dolosicoccus paucivorans]|uniref:Hydroxymethylglutaryl-CoA synthase n=1 Tax=Dolosicoccus paucivorans TaxID=84521 RepID=A0A1G8NBJ2_9LACT|nr:hydroxymethylglutaryl-CoA synthase [Dolosicoccus paucivorans]PMB84864.1 hydroxymethylglutaryl-CoA synthase [Dolosicoccus paucivorans]PMC58860.1 hydroxymethylglutaryl-CoA synthase [Dolosicoccus paucivorans]SDI77538.1 hydroxymethylglutaryl-CoA synthase [Dolosicoccus paucivorans]